MGRPCEIDRDLFFQWLLKGIDMAKGPSQQSGFSTSDKQFEQRNEQAITHSGQAQGSADAPFTLPELPFAMDALAPTISAKTLEFHHGKHHKAYVDKAN